MNVLNWFDNRTLLACQSLIVATFGFTFLGISVTYPKLRGVRTIAAGYLLGCPATLLVAMRGMVPPFLSIVVANSLIYLCYLLLYRGLQQHFGDKGHQRLAAAIVIGACCLHFYFTSVHDDLLARIILVSITVSALLGLMAVSLFRHARDSVHRTAFGISLTFFAIVAFSRAPLTLIHGAPGNYMQTNTIQTFTLLGGVFSNCIHGLFFLMLISFEVANTINQKAQRDPLTNSFNRRGIEVRLRDELARSARAGTILCIMLIDIDHFKAINDTHGHNAGDAALKLVATMISGWLRPYDHLGRFGGDEFLLVLPELTLDQAVLLSERFHHPRSGPTLSIGIAQCDPGESPLSLLARADAALYKAKASGRDCTRVEISVAHLVP